MPVYRFKAKDHNQRIVRGRMKAGSQDEVEQRLHTRQFTLISSVVEEKKRNKLSEITIGGASTKNLVLATRQLAFLVKASVPIVQALDVVSNNTDDVALRKIFDQVSQSISSGKSFSASLKNFPREFNELYVNMIHAGEEGGSLDVMLNQLATYTEKTENIKRRVKSAMMYPIFVASAAILIVIGMIVFLVPQFQEIFSDAGQDLPALTQLLVDVSDFVRNHYIFMVVSIITLIGSFITYIKSHSGSRVWEKIVISLPLGFGSLFLKNYIARFCRTLACLLGSGGNIVESISIAGKSSGSVLFKDASVRISDAVEKGFRFGKVLSQEKLFPGLVRNMVTSGEQTGNIDEILMKIAEFCEEQVDAAIEGIMKLIEPVMIVSVAVIIGFILVALYLPIFEMSGTLAGG